MKCDHYACRCARAAELAAIADRLNDPRMLADAIAVHEQLVECRLPPAIMSASDHRYQAGAYGVCRRCGRSFKDH